MGIVGGVKGVVMTLEGVDSVLYQKEIVGAVLCLKGVMGVVLHQKEMIQPPVALHSHALLPELHSIRNPSHDAQHLPPPVALIPSPPSHSSRWKSTDCDSRLQHYWTDSREKRKRTPS